MLAVEKSRGKQVPTRPRPGLATASSCGHAGHGMGRPNYLALWALRAMGVDSAWHGSGLKLGGASRHVGRPSQLVQPESLLEDRGLQHLQRCVLRAMVRADTDTFATTSSGFGAFLQVAPDSAPSAACMCPAQKARVRFMMSQTPEQLQAAEVRERPTKVSSFGSEAMHSCSLPASESRRSSAWTWAPRVKAFSKATGTSNSQCALPPHVEHGQTENSFLAARSRALAS